MKSDSQPLDLAAFQGFTPGRLYATPPSKPGGSGQTKAEKFKARQRANRAEWEEDGTRTAHGERKHAQRMSNWARRYYELNGAPEGDDDR